MKTSLDMPLLVLIVAMMFTVGLELEARHFWELGRRWRILLWVLGSQIIILPMAGVLLTRLIPLPHNLTMGILLVAACPVGDIANFYTLLARGNVVLSFAVNGASCLLSFLSMGVVFAVYSFLLGGEFEFAVPPVLLVSRLALLVAVPILAGMGLRKRWLRRTEQFSPVLRAACVLGILAFCAAIVVVQSRQLAADWKLSAAASICFMLLVLTIGWVVGRAMNLHAADRFTVATLFPVRNVALALTIAITMLNRIEYAAFVIVYFLTEVPLLLGLVVAFRRWWAVLPLTATQSELPR